MSSCFRCPSGCLTSSAAFNATCPKFWQKVDSSELCTQSWSCHSASVIGIRTCGAVFLALALVYCRLIYFNYKKSAGVNLRQSLKVKLGLSCIRASSPMVHARHLMTCATLIRGIDCVTFFSFSEDTASTCPMCFSRSSRDDAIINLVFNAPIALMMIATIIIFSEWEDIFKRCIQMTKATPTGIDRVFGTLFSKLPMFASTVVWACLFLYAGHLAQTCQVYCTSAVQRYAYFIVITLWLLQYMVFCLFWGRSVTKAILQSRDQVLSALKDKHEASSTQGLKRMWEHFAEVFCLASCMRLNTGTEDLLRAQNSDRTISNSDRSVSLSDDAVPTEGVESPRSSESGYNETETEHDRTTVAHTALLVVDKLQTAASRVKYAQYVATAEVVFTAFFLALGTGLGFYQTGADAATYFAFQIVLRFLEIAYVASAAIFLA